MNIVFIDRCQSSTGHIYGTKWRPASNWPDSSTCGALRRRHRGQRSIPRLGLSRASAKKGPKQLLRSYIHFQSTVHIYGATLKLFFFFCFLINLRCRQIEAHNRHFIEKNWSFWVPSFFFWSRDVHGYDLNISVHRLDGTKFALKLETPPLLRLDVHTSLRR